MSNSDYMTKFCLIFYKNRTNFTVLKARHATLAVHAAAAVDDLSCDIGR